MPTQIEAPARAKAGSEIEIAWTGPKGPSDFITVVEPGAEVVAELGQVIRAIEGKDASLANQLRRAGASVALSIAEGEHAMGRRRQASFSVALGSARECRACVHVGEALGYLREGESAGVLDGLDHVVAMLFKLVR